MTGEAAVNPNKTVRKRSQLKAIWFQYRKNKLAMFGLILFCALVMVAVASGFFLDYEAQVIEQRMKERLQPPS